jgi:GNS1/SUR4 family.
MSHIIRYFYYFVTTQWPEYENQIWWKKYITQLQMVSKCADDVSYHHVLLLLCDHPVARVEQPNLVLIVLELLQLLVGWQVKRALVSLNLKFQLIYFIHFSH